MGGFFQRTDLGRTQRVLLVETTVTIPEEFAGKCVVFQLTTGREGEWDATNPQFTIYVNGKLVQGLDVNHREVILAEKAAAGETYRIILSAFTGDQNFSLRLDACLRVLDRVTEKYFYDLNVPYQTARLLPEDSQAYLTILKAVNEVPEPAGYAQGGFPGVLREPGTGAGEYHP